MVSRDRLRNSEALCVLIIATHGPPGYIPELFTAVIDYLEGEVSLSLFEQAIRHLHSQKNVPRPDYFLKILPSGSKVTVILKRAVIENQLHNVVTHNVINTAESEDRWD